VVAAIKRNDPLLGTWAISEAVLNYRDSSGRTVLHHACKEKRVAFARRLIAANAPLNVLGNGGETALTLAVGSEDIDLVSAMIAAGADVNLEGTQDLAMAPLFLAAQRANLGLVRILLQARADPNERGLELHATPLLAAAMHAGSIPILTALLEAGASLTSTNAKGEGVLEASIISDDPAVIQFFVDHGAKWLEPYQGYNALVEAAQLGKRESVRKLLALGIYSDDALAAAKDPAIRELLEEKGSVHADSTAGDGKPWLAICADTQNGRARAEAFISKGGNVNYLVTSISLHSWTPLSLALKSSNFELARFLLAQGANPNVSVVDLYGELLGHGESDSLGKQGLRDQDVADAARMLLDAGYGPPVPGYVVIAAGNGWSRTVELFLERGVSKDEVIRNLGEITPQFMPDEKRAQILRMLQ
jgi:ankyrin repeat protein